MAYRGQLEVCLLKIYFQEYSKKLSREGIILISQRHNYVEDTRKASTFTHMISCKHFKNCVSELLFWHLCKKKKMSWIKCHKHKAGQSLIALWLNKQSSTNSWRLFRSSVTCKISGIVFFYHYSFDNQTVSNWMKHDNQTIHLINFLTIFPYKSYSIQTLSQNPKH